MAQQSAVKNTPAETMKEIFVVLNPVAGDGRADDVRAALEQHFNTETWHYTIYETSGEEDMPAVLQKAIDEGCDWVFAAGGDGTVSEVADGLINREIPLGIIPVGTANSLAQDLEIPLAPEEACRLLAGETTTRKIDALRIGERYAVLQVGVGLDSLMISNTSREDKNRLGIVAYVWSMLKGAVGWQPRHFQIVADGETHQVQASEVLVANAAYLGLLGMEWGGHIRPDDGRFDICIIHMRTLTDYLQALVAFLRGRQRQATHVRYLEATRSIEISAGEPLPVQADGELLGKTPLKAEVVPAAVPIIVSAS